LNKLAKHKPTPPIKHNKNPIKAIQTAAVNDKKLVETIPSKTRNTFVILTENNPKHTRSPAPKIQFHMEAPVSGLPDT
jgi:hypothetical protein